MKSTAEIKKALNDEGVEYTIHGGKYITADLKKYEEQGGCVSDFADYEQISQNDPRLTLFSARGFDDEKDMYEVLAYCGLYTGQ